MTLYVRGFDMRNAGTVKCPSRTTCQVFPPRRRDGVPLMSSHSAPITGALTGVAAVSKTAQSLNNGLTLLRYWQRTRCALMVQSASCNVLAINLSTGNGSNASALVRRSCKCRLPPSLAVMILEKAVDRL